MNTPSYYRERINRLPDYSGRYPEYASLFRNGHVPEALRAAFSEDIYTGVKEDNTPLKFTEITVFNTWFDMHPEKVCGQEKITTSMQFPLTIKGNIKDAIASIRQQLNQPNKSRALALAQARAKALKLKLQLDEHTEFGNILSGILDHNKAPENFKNKKSLTIK